MRVYLGTEMKSLLTSIPLSFQMLFLEPSREKQTTINMENINKTYATCLNLNYFAVIVVNRSALILEHLKLEKQCVIIVVAEEKLNRDVPYLQYARS